MTPPPGQDGPLRRAIDAQRGHLFHWVPICLSLGIGGYFALSREPVPAEWAGLATLFAGLALLAWRGAGRWPVVTALALVLLGMLLAGVRSQGVAAPVLGWRYYGPVEGRVTAVDRSASDVPRVTLDRVVLENLAPERTPRRVRLSFHGDQSQLELTPGARLIATAHLGPPQGPTEPGAFDFRRMAWFRGLGAVGYSRSPALVLAPPDGTLPVARLRMRISAAVQAALPGEVGAFAAAILTGDRSGMGRETLQALRDSNLAHLLAISGLHMGLLTSVVFAALRIAMALVPRLALGHPTKKYAAVGALLAGAGYLALSGGNVATQRAFIMVAVVLGAVLMDRRALTLRAVALAATIVLVIRPEALTEPGFQMSFAATTALIAVFRALRDRPGPRLPRWLRPVAAVVISSGVAGLGTAPIAAAHFNQISNYGLIANLLSVPLMGAVVMPAAVAAACLAPLGLADLGLAVMAPAIAWIVGVAHEVAGWEGALRRVPTPGGWVIPLFSLGMLWLILWQGRLRLAGLLPAAVAIGLWAQVERPELLISDSGGLVGVLTKDGRVLSKPRGEGFVAQNWLENDGDLPVQAVAFDRDGIEGKRGWQSLRVAGMTVIVLGGRGAASRVAEACAQADLVVVSVDADPATGYGCRVFDRALLRESGSVAIRAGADGPVFDTVRQRAGNRPWSRQ